VARETATAADLVEGLRRRWPLALLVALPMFAAVVTYAETLPSTYESSAVVALTPRPDIDVGGDVLRVVVPKYVAYLGARPALSAVAERAGVDPDELRGGVDVSVAPDTSQLEIVVEMLSAADAAAAARELAEEAVSLSASDRLLEADVLVPAVAVQDPAGPPRRLIEAGGLLLALLAGAALALVVDRSQPRVSTTDNLAAVTGVRTLAALPRTRKLRQPAHVALDDPLVSASIGTLLVQLDSESRLQPVRVLAVTSPSPGDGKTTVATALATGLAKLEVRVLLLDADLRRPRAAQQLGMSSDGPGLGEVLEGTVPIGQVMRSHQPSNLYVVPTQPHADAGNLLARRLKQVLSDVSDQFDIVVLDCPPVLATDDALVVTVICDATLLVVDRGSRSVQAQAAASTLLGLKVRVLGSVLNRARQGAGGAQAYGSYGRR
jgi:capsular exopolysaccharide synthesis family protein